MFLSIMPLWLASDQLTCNQIQRLRNVCRPFSKCIKSCINFWYYKEISFNIYHCLYIIMQIEGESHFRIFSKCHMCIVNYFHSCITFMTYCDFRLSVRNKLPVSVTKIHKIGPSDCIQMSKTSEFLGLHPMDPRRALRCLDSMPIYAPLATL